MKRTKLIYVTALAIFFAFHSVLSSGEGFKRVWQVSSCSTFSLAVRDKMISGEFIAKYVVRSTDGDVFIAEKKADDFESARVIFPDDFHDERTKLRMGMSCHMTYKWYIYADGILVDKGTASFSREGSK